MTDDPTTRLADYAPPPWLVEEVTLDFRLDPAATRVRSAIRFRRNPERSGDFTLDGEGLKLIAARIDGQPPAGMTRSETGLSIPGAGLPERFLWESEVEIAPQDNTALEGLYMSGGIYCTQCEAEGFRRITFYPDRPDVMAPFRVRIEGAPPVLLSNGNPVAGSPGRAEWHDPWPKPAYLFALVAGDLVSVDDRFTTRSGRRVDLRIWVRAGDEHRCAWAMDCLKRAMKWDEETYGREYDLDLFQIVAVDDFNMGAMENKGLNIFNSKYVLASPETATDRDFALIEGIIAHEYFHNWTGNRITCRDWFQLSLKEGLTVFRDQQFSGDARGHAVQRIAEVQQLRARQFREDAGPLAHPVRPTEYREINNFYTATVYEKGAELIRMLKTLVGDDAYARALDLYFDRHDGQACTIENWLAVFEDTTGRDLTQFRRWYEQAGTPRLQLRESFADGTLTLHFRQHTPPGPGQEEKQPVVIPIAVGLLNPEGGEAVPTTVLEMRAAEQSFAFGGLAARPVASVLRGFSAPVILERESGDDTETRAFLLAHDSDPFNRWEAGRALAMAVLLDSLRAGGTAAAPAYVAALGKALTDPGLEPAFRALILQLPGEEEIARALHEAGETADPAAVHDARQSLSRTIGTELETLLEALWQEMAVPGPYSPAPAPAGRRALRHGVLAHLSPVDGGARARALFARAGNMTEAVAALSALIPLADAGSELAEFHRRWRQDALVIDKWFALQAALAPPERAVAVARLLSERADFDWRNPNRFRALLGGLAANQAGFHHPSGAGYALLTDWLLKLDPHNPQTAARMIGAFDSWRWFDPARQALIRTQLERLRDRPGLSRDSAEMVARLLGG